MTALLRPMTGRDPNEAHRASTPLELLVDLCFVVAVSRCAAALHHQLGEAHFAHGITTYLFIFWAIWWAWMNFTWFASSYDTDDAAYRALTFVQILGVLILAAGVTDAFAGHQATVAVGFLVMRFGLSGQYLRASFGDSENARACRIIAIGLIVLQIGWIGRLTLSGSVSMAFTVLLVVAELALPMASGFLKHQRWHPGHIAERYSLLLLIVLGESILSATNAIEEGIHEGGVTSSLVMIVVGSAALVFCLWWRYFDFPVDDALREDPSKVVAWGFGHYFAFAAIAALGAGIELVVDRLGGAAELSKAQTVAAVAIPTVVFVLVTSSLHLATGTTVGSTVVRSLTISAGMLGLVAIAPWVSVPVAVLGLGLLASVGVTASLVEQRRSPATASR
jgi:low temperature requirement protein LtrA